MKSNLRQIKVSLHHWAFTTLLLAGFVVLAGYIAISVWPAFGAWGADELRGLIGDRAVAGLETMVFQIQDATARAFMVRSRAETSSTEPIVADEPISPAWLTDLIPASGRVAGEGKWMPYIQDAQGRTVAYRTFLLPDSQRLYAEATILAFDLNATCLHFALGTEEPRSPVTLERSGKIPDSDLRSGTLLAILNGGFKARHGRFGVKVNDVTLLPLRGELGTVAIYADGHTRIGRWGAEITASPDLVAARQNGPLIVHAGVVNPYTEFTESQAWGYIVGNNTPTWRSGLGISADGRSLYYVVGPGLTLSRLAEVLAMAGAAEALQLDINPAWVYAGSVHITDSKLHVLPLLDFMPRIDNLEEYSFSRDFFYVTSGVE